MEMIGIIFIIGIITLGIYKLFELFARRKERMAMIEKFSEGITPQFPKGNTFDIRILKDLSDGSWSIRIGMLLFGVGLGIVIATIVDLSIINLQDDARKFRNTIDVLYPACAALFGGLGLIAAYFIEQKKQKKDKNQQEE